MAVVCACIPSLRPLFSVIGHGFSHAPFVGRTSNSISRESSSKHLWGSGMRQTNSRFSQLEEMDDLRPLGHDVAVRGGRTEMAQDEEENLEMPEKGIRVKTEVTLVTSDRLDYNDRLF